MKKTLGSFLLAALLASSPLLAAKDLAKETLTFAGKERTYYLYIPKSLKPDTPAPVLVLFHGSGRNGLSLVERWKKLAEEEGVVLIGPDAADPQQWHMPQDPPELVQALLEQVGKRQAIQPRRVYLFGHSGGAGHVLLLSLLESEYFAAGAIHAGRLQEGNLSVIDRAKRKIPIHIIVGTQDPLFPLELVRATRDALTAKGIPATMEEIRRHDHDYYKIAFRINDEAWSFLKQHELPGDPKFEVYRF
jgi:poly(3-hydroxybutyrate) depolymerase